MSVPNPRSHLTLGVWLLWTSAVYAAREVIVIGAGASGLAAARKLTNDGGVKVIVLEARPDRYGGRIWTNTVDFTNVTGPEVDMGASFVHHPAPDNPVVQQLAELGIPILKLNESAILAVSDADGTRYDSHTIETTLGTVYTALDDSMKNAKAQEKDESIESFLRKTNNSRLIASPLSQLLVAEVEFDYGAPLDEISAQMFDVGYGENNDADNFLPEKGYGQMVDMLVQRNSTDSRLDIRLGREVTAVTVLETRRVEVKCRDDSRYEADAVIVTVPLGVLKAGVIRFTPQLPLRKRDSIRRIGFGVINKLVLEFDQVFWPKDVYHLYAVLTNTTQRGDFTLIANLFPVTRSPILVFFAVSYFGKVSESLSDEELKTVAFARLRTIFGNVTNTVTVVNMARTRWLSDPFTRGAYSVPDIGVKADDWDRIGEPLPPLFFAGEHTQTKYYATVQTALETGWRAANQTLQYFNDSSAATKIRIPSALAITLIIVHSIESIKRRF